MLIEKVDPEFKNETPVVNYEERVIWFRGRISNTTAFVFQSILNRLESKSHEPIKFFISGIGGDFFASRKIWGLISASPCNFSVIAFDFVKSGCFFLTQSNCNFRLAVEGTKFSFHLAIDYFQVSENKITTMNQKDYQEALRKLQVIDAFQFTIFSLKGRPASEIFEMLMDEKTIDTATAKRMNLIDDVVSEEDFAKYRSLVFSQDN